MSSELDFLITVGHDMRVVSHVYLVLITEASCQHRSQGNPPLMVSALAKLTHSIPQYYAIG